MPQILIACSMLEDEIRQIMEQENLQYPVHWMPRGLHAVPENLRRELQTVITSYEAQYDTILLGYCLCGGSLRGVRSARATLAAMNCYDCVNMLMCREGIDNHSLYFTAGWLRSDQFIGKEYDEVLKKRGAQKTEKLYSRILQGYTHLRMMDTGAYDLAACEEQARQAAQKLKLTYCVKQASTEILRKLLRHEWDETILTAQPGQSLGQDA